MQALLPLGGALYVGTSSGLDRWDLASGKRQRLGAAEGIVGTSVRALAPAGGGRVWFATDVGIGEFDGERASMLPPPPDAIATAAVSVRALVVDTTGGVWAGGDAGLFHADIGGWTRTSFRAEVTALHLASNGELWIGSHDGVLVRGRDGVVAPVAAGQVLRDVFSIVDGPDGVPVVIGTDAQGHSRLATFSEGQFTTYRLSDGAGITRAIRTGAGLILCSAGRLLLLSNTDSPRKDSVQLIAVEGKRRPYRIAMVDVATSEAATAIAAEGVDVYIGTPSLGIEQITLSNKPAAPVAPAEPVDAESGSVPLNTMAAQSRWLRPHELTFGARNLFVTCHDRDECYVATGGLSAWHYDGRGFTPLVIGHTPVIVLAVVRDARANVLALYREPGERMLHLAKLADGAFRPVGELRVETPSGATVLSFARFAADGLLWLGLQYLDSDGDARPYGVAIVDLTLGGVSYHHEGGISRKSGVLPIPNDVVDVAFLDEEVWFASGSGAARLKGEQLRIWTEADELRSEILHGVVATEGGLVYVASASGVGQFDGAHWSYPPALNLVTNGLARGTDGRLWLGTDAGLVVYDGRSTERFERRDGLADDRVLDVAVDYLGRIWARGVEGLSIINPP